MFEKYEFLIHLFLANITQAYFDEIAPKFPPGGISAGDLTCFEFLRNEHPENLAHHIRNDWDFHYYGSMEAERICRRE